MFFNTMMMGSGAGSAPESAPVISGTTSFSVEENTSTSTVLATYTATGTSPITWSVTGTDASNFNINSSGQLTFAVSPDYETTADRSQSINVVATNAVGSDTVAVSVTVTNDTSDDPPVFTNGAGGINLTRQEGYAGSPSVFGFRASGGGTISWSVGGTDGSQFNVNSVGDVSFNSHPDYENPTDSGSNNVYNFSVTASNAYGSATVNNTVTITNDTSDDIVPTITVTAHGSTTNYTASSFTLTASSNTADIYTTTSSNPKLYTMTVNTNMTVDVDVRGGAGGGSYGGNGGRVTGRMTLSTGTTYYMITGAAGTTPGSAEWSKGGYGGGASGGDPGSVDGTSFGNGGWNTNSAGAASIPTGSYLHQFGDAGGGLSGIFSGSPSQGNAIIIAGGGGGTGKGSIPLNANGGDGGGGSGSSQSGTDGTDAGNNTGYISRGGDGGTTSSAGAGGAGGIGGNTGSSGGAGRGGHGGYDFNGSGDFEGGGGGGGGYNGGGGGGANADNFYGNNAAGGGGGSAYTSNAVSSVGGSRGYNSGQGRITITRV